MSLKDDIRKEILFQAYARRPLPISGSKVLRECKKLQMNVTLDDIVRELPFLAGERLLEPYAMPGVTELHYVISAAGVRHYEQNFAE